MSVPRLTEVFLSEASLRAYQMAGWSRPEAKKWFEKTYGPVALEVAIITMALIENEDDDYGVDMVADDPAFQRWVATLKKSSKFRDMVKKHSKELLSIKKEGGDAMQSRNKAFNAVHTMAQKFMVEPEEYQGETALEFEDGWKWVHLTEAECNDYEGVMMQHCGQASGLMFSLRDPQGKPHVTVDVSPPGGVDDGPLNIPANDIIQIRGKQNSIPDMKYWPKIKDLVQQVGAKALWDSYAKHQEGESEDLGVVQSRKIADFMELEWAHDPALHQEPTPLDQYEF